MKTVGVIGAGPMGLACAYELLKAGHRVTIFERDSRIGGMSASFELDGLKIERYYHFVCAPDQTLFSYLKEFELLDRLQWRETRMGFFYQGKLYRWGDPVGLLRFPHLDLLSKVRYGLHTLYATRTSDWRGLDRITATEWLLKWVGRKTYDVLWKPLFALKFFEYQHSLSAAWLAARIKRVGLSRRNAFVERLGYLKGGSDTFLDEISARINRLGGVTRLRSNIRRIRIEDGSVRGLETDDASYGFDSVVSTIPLAYLARMAPDLPASEREKIAAIRNIGVVCVTLKLERSLTGNFWTNINDPRIEVPGLVEYSNLNPLPSTIVYAPFYMPQTHPKYSASKERFIEEVVGYLAMINPSFNSSWVKAANVFRYEYAQTICTPGFFAKLPDIRSSVSGLYMADTSHYYPEDRSMSESLRIGRSIAAMVAQHAESTASAGAI